MWFKNSAFAGVGVALLAFSIGCAAEGVQAARAVVTGPEDRVLEFHQNLMAAFKRSLGSNNPEAIGVTCDLPSASPGEFNCDKLNGESSESTRVIYTLFRDKNQKRLRAFVLAWDKAQNRKLDNSLKIQFDTDTPTGDCNGFVGQCVNAPFCPGPPKRCDKVQGPPCTRCGT